MRRRSILGWLTATLASSCAPVDLLNATVSTREVTRREVAYGPGPRGGMTVYVPDGAGPHPVVVFIYGGAWRHGERADYKFVGAALAKAGIVTAIPDYRLYPPTRFPGFVEDAAAATAFVLAHATQWGGDPGRVFLAGHSAGAHIALLLALDPRYLEAAGTRREALTGVIGIAGPYDFLPIHDPDVREVFAGTDPHASQPIDHVDGQAPALLLLHGDADTTVEPRNTRALAAKVRAAGGVEEARIYPGVGHIGIVLGFAGITRDRSPVLADVVRFVASTPRART